MKRLVLLMAVLISWPCCAQINVQGPGLIVQGNAGTSGTIVVPGSNGQVIINSGGVLGAATGVIYNGSGGLSANNFNAQNYTSTLQASGVIPVNLLVCLNGSVAIVCPGSATSWAGISTASTGSSVTVALAGQTACQFDGTPRLGDFVRPSTGTAGNCNDSGGTPTGTMVGQIVSVGTGNVATVQMSIVGPIGPVGPAGPPGGSLSYPGVTSDGRNGLAVTGYLAAQNIVDVTNYGAVGDYNPSTSTSGTDNTSAINAAITAACNLTANGGTATLRFPLGDYKFTNLAFHCNNIEISGNGATLWSTLPKNTGTNALMFQGSNLYLHDFTLNYTVPINNSTGTDIANRGAGGALYVGGDPHNAYSVTDTRIDHVQIFNARNGGMAIKTTNRATVTNCTVVHTLGNGIGFSDVIERVIATGNHIEDTGDDLLVAVADSSLPGQMTQVVIFSNNTVKGGYGKGIATTGAQRVIISGNSVDDTYAGGIVPFQDTFYNLGPSADVLVSHNHIKNAGTHYGSGQFQPSPSNVADGVYIESGGTTERIVDNEIQLGIRDGITIAPGGTNYDIEGNTITGVTSNGINIGDSSHATRTTNVIVQNNTILSPGASGITIFTITGCRLIGNYVRTFNAGNLGTTYGIGWDYIDDCMVDNNLVINDASPVGLYGFRQITPGSNGGRVSMFRNLSMKTGDAALTDFDASVKAGTWSITSGTSVAVSFSSGFNPPPTSCSVTATSDPTAVGAIWYSNLTYLGFTVNIHTAGVISGTYQCVVQNSN